MRIARVELYALELPFAEPFILSGGRIDARRSVVVVLHDGEGHVGYGESAPDELPFYSEETLGSARDLIPRVLAPRIAGQEFDSPEAVDAALRENVRGNPFARAGIDTGAASAAGPRVAQRRTTRAVSGKATTRLRRMIPAATLRAAFS